MYDYGYRFNFASFSEVVFPDGTVVRRIEQPGGAARYAITEKFLNDDEYFQSLADQGIDNDGREITGDELEPWLACIDEQDLDDIMTPAEVSMEYGVRQDTVRDACQNGWITARKSGKTWLMRRVDAEARWAKKYLS